MKRARDKVLAWHRCQRRTRANARVLPHLGAAAHLLASHHSAMQESINGSAARPGNSTHSGDANVSAARNETDTAGDKNDGLARHVLHPAALDGDESAATVELAGKARAKFRSRHRGIRHQRGRSRKMFAGDLARARESSAGGAVCWRAAAASSGTRCSRVSNDGSGVAA